MASLYIEFEDSDFGDGDVEICDAGFREPRRGAGADVPGRSARAPFAAGSPAYDPFNRGGPATIVSDGCTGFICDVDDAEAFAACARRLRDDPGLRQRMSLSARQAAESRPWLAVMRKLERNYGEAVCLHARLRRWRTARC